MILTQPLNYFPIITPMPVIPKNETYIKIGSYIYYEANFNTFLSFNFKLNKRGGDSSSITFAYPMQKHNVSDKVLLVIKGKTVYRGYIESITEYGTEFNIIPAWSKLDEKFITDTLEIEETKNIKDIVIGMKAKIEEAGIIFNTNNIDLPENKNMVVYDITTSMAGKSLKEILEELEDELPETCFFGVDANNMFYFKTFNDYLPTKYINWHYLDYSEDEIEEDYSNIYSQYVVKHKKYNALGEQDETYEVLKYIMGSEEAKSVIIDGKEYNFGPIQKWQDLVGIKTTTIEYNFESDKLEAYQYAYDMLQKQNTSKSIKLTNYNIDRQRLNINDCVGITTSPKQNVIVDINNSNYNDVDVISNNGITGYVYKFGDMLGTYKTQQKYTKEFKLEGMNLRKHLFRALAIKKLKCNYIVKNKTDNKGNLITALVEGNFVNIRDYILPASAKEYKTATAGNGTLKIEALGYSYNKIARFYLVNDKWQNMITIEKKSDSEPLIFYLYPMRLAYKQTMLGVCIDDKEYRFAASEDSTQIKVEITDSQISLTCKGVTVKTTRPEGEFYFNLNTYAYAGQKEGYFGLIDLESERKQEAITLSDGRGHSKEAIGINGIVEFEDIEEFDKYTLKLTTSKRAAIWESLTVMFNQYSDYDVLNVREIEYDYSNGTLAIDVTLNKINAMLTGYMFEQNKRIETLETLLTNSSGE